MKKPLLLISSFLLSVTGFAQITVTSADVATAGTTVVMGRDTMATVTIGSAGTNKTWNFSSLTPDEVETLDFVAPASTPYAAQFPGANLSMIQTTPGGTSYIYLVSNSSTVSVDGVADATLFADFNPNEQIISLPATYGTPINSTTKFTVRMPYTAVTGYDSLMIKSMKTKNGSFDAWGSLTIPLGTFNTIRQYELQRTTDSIFIHAVGPFPPAGWYFAQESKDSTYHYAWWTNGKASSLVEIDSTVGSTGDVRFMAANPGPTNVASAVSQSSNVYPNPASEMINFVYDGNGNTELVIFNVTGSKVSHLVMQPGINQVDVQSYPAGMYLYSQRDATGKVVKTGRFTVVK